ncbi:MAG: HEAT repeat domain-containing protein [Thermoguttaceae bacterium]|nr:HEAT repeat domain-containing protein [Thermoguttaceae bacterium]MDW8037934.1 HEAT repeat domain-containing protein [Thermoguttaceae bacterium]
MSGSLSPGLSTTLELLARTDNQAAVPLLVWALESPFWEIRQGAFEALLEQENRQGHRELLARLHRMPFGWLERMREYGDRLRPALREAIVSADSQLRHNGCQAAVWLGQYEVIPTLLAVLEQSDNADSAPILAALYDLVEQLRCRSSPGISGGRGEEKTLHTQVVASLEGSLQRWSEHRRTEIVELFLHLADPNHPILLQVLQSPHHPLHLPMVDVLTKSRSPVVQELLLSFLEQPQLPLGVLLVFGKRSDGKFVRQWLRKIARSQSPVLEQNLKRLRNISWLRAGGAILQGLDSWAELGLVRLAVLSGIPRQEAFGVIEYVFRYGKPAGRRAAAEALAAFSGAAANALALEAIEDPDPYVQAAAIGHIRQRGIPGVLPRLLALLDSPHAVVRHAVRKSLRELNFKRFLHSFDLLEDSVRRQTGLLVKKIDPQTIPLLQQELQSPIRSRRLRAIAIARSIDAQKPLEPILQQLAQEDPDAQVRQEAAAALAELIVPGPKNQPQNTESPVGKATVGPKPAASATATDPLTQYRRSLWDPRD